VLHDPSRKNCVYRLASEYERLNIEADKEAWQVRRCLGFVYTRKYLLSHLEALFLGEQQKIASNLPRLY